MDSPNGWVGPSAAIRPSNRFYPLACSANALEISLIDMREEPDLTLRQRRHSTHIDGLKSRIARPCNQRKNCLADAACRSLDSGFGIRSWKPVRGLIARTILSATLLIA